MLLEFVKQIEKVRRVVFFFEYVDCFEVYSFFIAVFDEFFFNLLYIPYEVGV